MAVAYMPLMGSAKMGQLFGTSFAFQARGEGHKGRIMDTNKKHPYHNVRSFQPASLDCPKFFGQTNQFFEKAYEVLNMLPQNEIDNIDQWMETDDEIIIEGNTSKWPRKNFSRYQIFLEDYTKLHTAPQHLHQPAPYGEMAIEEVKDHPDYDRAKRIYWQCPYLYEIEPLYHFFYLWAYTPDTSGAGTPSNLTLYNLNRIPFDPQELDGKYVFGYSAVYEEGTFNFEEMKFEFVNYRWKEGKLSAGYNIHLEEPDWNRVKPIEVTSTSNTPTISRAQPLKITSGDDSTTGTGEIVIDWSNISSKSDIVVLDENGNILDYYFEKFDTSNQVAVIWVYRDWIRDGTVQVQVAYGNGPTENEAYPSTVFDKDSTLQAKWLLNEDPSGPVPQWRDRTSNGNDGETHGLMETYNKQPGIVNSSWDFDGYDDYVEVHSSSSLDNIQAISLWFKSERADQKESIIDHYNGNTDRWILFGGYNFQVVPALWTWAHGFQLESDNDLDGDNTWHHIVIIWTGSKAQMYIDGTLQSMESSNNPFAEGIGGSMNIAADLHDYYPQDYFAGLIDNISIHNSSLSVDTIQAKYDATQNNPDFFSQKAGQQK